jgi:hypothetical protein
LYPAAGQKHNIGFPCAAIGGPYSISDYTEKGYPAP